MEGERKDEISGQKEILGNRSLHIKKRSRDERSLARKMGSRKKLPSPQQHERCQGGGTGPFQQKGVGKGPGQQACAAIAAGEGEKVPTFLITSTKRHGKRKEI